MQTSVIRQKLVDSISLIKPRITTVTLLTTFTGIWIGGSGQLPSVSTLLMVLIGTGLGVSSSCLLNNYFDRHIDRHMSRTEDRPLPAGRISPPLSLVAGLLFGLMGVFLLASTVNMFAAGLLFISIVNYGFLYTLWFKRETPYATEVVGLSGALAPVIGWIAVQESLSVMPVLLFGMMFLWQPGHFWALGLLYRNDYENVNLPRYPVVHGIDQTKKRLLAYTVLLAITPPLMTLYSGFGLPFLVLSTGAGIGYLALVLWFQYQPVNRPTTLKVFFGSIAYLTCMLLLMILSVPFSFL